MSGGLSAADRLQRILASRWETYAEDMPAILVELAAANDRSYLIIEPAGGEWPAYAQVAAVDAADRDNDIPVLHAELQHPSMRVKHGEPVPVLPPAVLATLHAEGWQDPVEEISPNFWMRLEATEAEALAIRLLRALLTMSPRTGVALSFETSGPVFARPLGGPGDKLPEAVVALMPLAMSAMETGIAELAAADGFELGTSAYDAHTRTALEWLRLAQSLLVDTHDGMHREVNEAVRKIERYLAIDWTNRT